MKPLELGFTDEKPLEKYRWWDVYDELPDGWVIDEYTGSPMTRTVFITNGKSMISGNQKRALLRVKPKPTVFSQETVLVKKK